MGRYVARRLLNYVILLFIAVSLTYFLAATQLNPRSLYLIVNPPLDPASIEQSSASTQPQRQRPTIGALLDLAYRHRDLVGLG